jgi:hypothetical protein
MKDHPVRTLQHILLQDALAHSLSLDLIVPEIITSLSLKKVDIPPLRREKFMSLDVWRVNSSYVALRRAICSLKTEILFAVEVI